MNDAEKTITGLSDILDQDIEAIVELRLKAERKVGRHQRLIERLTDALGRPFSVYLLLILVVLWIGINLLEKMLGLAIFDAPPFPWLQDSMSIGAFFMTVVILTTQNRQSREEEQRRHLELQINLLTERKVSKMISLLEDLRRDMPHVEDRVDPEAVALQEPVDPHHALKALNKTWLAASQEIEQATD